MYVVAGFCGHELNDVHSFDTATQQWRREAEGQFSARSVCPHAVITHPQTGQPHLVVFGGELSPSARGHEGAGNFGNDVLAFPVQPDGRVGAAITVPYADDARPPARGWTQMAAASPSELVVFGGLAGTDEEPVRLADIYRLTFE